MNMRYENIILEIINNSNEHMTAEQEFFKPNGLELWI